MHPFYEKFLNLLVSEDKENCVNFILDKLDKGEIDVVTLYTDILTLALNSMFCTEDDDDSECIWKEHVRTSIVRTILECCYPYLIKERKAKGIDRRNEKIIVVCPSEEIHEIGARMIVDYFTMLGFDAIFIGANTPREEILNAISMMKRYKYLIFFFFFFQ